MTTVLRNPFRPGAGHMPPYLAGREEERREFERILTQKTILQNLILTGPRGVGKTVLLETFKPIAIEAGWFWVGTDLSESSSITETNLVIRLLTDLSVVTSSFTITAGPARAAGLVKPQDEEYRLDYNALVGLADSTPGLASDKLKRVLEFVWECVRPLNRRGIIFAYDEAQNLGDHAADREYPLSLLLDVFQSIQRKGIPFLLVLTGLPTLFPKLVEARTYSERMFHVVMLDKLTEEASKEAILRPIEDSNCPINFSPGSVEAIYQMTTGYPYFIQYVCREVFDVWTADAQAGVKVSRIPVAAILRKLDADFFAGRWARATDRQRDLLVIIAHLENATSEFTVQEIVEYSRANTEHPFGPSQVSQMLGALSEAGLVYKNRWGKYSLAVPLLDQFIRRQQT